MHQNLSQSRVRSTTRFMREQGLNQIIISSTASVYYLTGFWVEPHERMLALLLRASGEMTLFGNALFGLPENGGVPLVRHTDGDDPVAALAAALEPGTVGIDKFWYSKFLLGLMTHRSDIRPAAGSAPVDLARMCKETSEQESMRRSSRINDEVMAQAVSALQKGVTEQALAGLINREYLRRGADGEGVQLVCFGESAADPHHAPGARELKPGDNVVCDLFAPIKRYWCDMTRTVFYQSVSPKQKEVYELVRQANEAAIAEVRPGVALSCLDKTARDVIKEGGYGDYFTHRLGHGCGLECHEPPDVSGVSHGLLKPGMVFSVEPGVYIPGEFGVRIEDLVLVTEDGCEVLNRYPKELQVVG